MQQQPLVEMAMGTSRIRRDDLSQMPVIPLKKKKKKEKKKNREEEEQEQEQEQEEQEEQEQQQQQQQQDQEEQEQEQEPMSASSGLSDKIALGKRLNKREEERDDDELEGDKIGSIINGFMSGDVVVTPPSVNQANTIEITQFDERIGNDAGNSAGGCLGALTALLACMWPFSSGKSQEQEQQQ
jgi:hypothetical protein